MNKHRKSACRVLAAIVLLVGLSISMSAPIFAAEPQLDMSNVYSHLAKLMGYGESNFKNYNSICDDGNPINYQLDSNSYYVALGGASVGGTRGVGRSDSIYPDLVAKALGLEKKYTAVSDQSLSCLNWDTFISENADTIRKADLITYQVDSASCINNSMASLLAPSFKVPWDMYFTDSSFVDTFNAFRTDTIAKLAPTYGETNSRKLCAVLESLLFEAVAYSYETLEAIEEIRKLNSDAVILVLGLYNPMKGLSFTIGSETVDFSSLLDDMMRMSNVHVLTSISDMDKVAFVDITDTNVAGFSNITMDLSDEASLTTKLSAELLKTDEKYANAAGHKYISERIIGATKVVEPCKHKDTKVVNKKDATCTQEGYSGDTVCNDCGETVKSGNKTDKASHNYGEWTEIKAPTCSQKGERERFCKDCNYKDVGSINKLPHNLNKGDETVKPGCETEGVKTFVCLDCGSTTTEPIPATDHTWDEGSITTAPGCEAEGEKTFTCLICSKTKTEPVKPAGHSWDNGTVTTAPGCETPGEKTTTCTACGASSTETVSANGHNFGEYVADGNATCSSDGTKTSTCTDCGKTDTVADENSKTEHNYEDGLCTYCNSPEPVKQGPSGFVWAIIGVVIGATASAVIAILITKKKK